MLMFCLIFTILRVCDCVCIDNMWTLIHGFFFFNIFFWQPRNSLDLPTVPEDGLIEIPTGSAMAAIAGPAFVSSVDSCGSLHSSSLYNSGYVRAV